MRKTFYKKIVSLLTCSIVIMSSLFISLANTENTEIKDSNPLFVDFISNATISEINIIDSFGNVINNKYSDSIKNNIVSGNYYEVLESLKKYDLALSYDDYEEEINPLDLSSEMDYDKDFYHLKQDSTGNLQREWITNLSGKYQGNQDGTLTKIGEPTIDVEASFGSIFLIKDRSHSTGSQYKNGNKAIEFHGSYVMEADLVVPLTIGGFEFPLGHTFSWGQINVNHTVGVE